MRGVAAVKDFRIGAVLFGSSAIIHPRNYGSCLENIGINVASLDDTNV